MRNGLRLCLVIPLVSAAIASAETGHWVPIGPEGGPIQTVAIDPGHPDSVYAAGFGSVFRSIGQNVDWQPLAPTGGRSIVFASGGVIYLGGTPSWKSTDSGTTWQRLDLVPEDAVVGIAVDPINPDVVYAVANQRLLKSVDGGVTWTRSTTGLPGFNDSPHTLLVDPQSPSTLYITDPQFGVYKSSDGGAVWAASNSGLPCPMADGEEYCLSSLALAPDDPATIYAGTYTQGVFRSNDAGASWTSSSDGLDGNGVSTLSVDPSSPKTLYVGGTDTPPFPVAPSATFGVYRSDDRGATWTAAGSGLPNLPIGAFAVSPTSPGLVYAASINDVGVYVTTDGGRSWAPASHGLSASCVTALLATATTPTTVLAVVAPDSVAASSDGGSSWTVLPLGDNVSIDRLVADPSDPATIYALAPAASGSQTTTLLKTTDGGKTWSSPGDPGGIIIDFAVDPLRPETLYAAIEGVSKSTDGGATWSVVHDATDTRGRIGAVAVDAASDAVLAAYDYGVFRSGDGGSTWDEITLDPPIGTARLVVVDTTPATLFVVTYQGVLYVSHDAGHTWQTTPPTLNGRTVVVVALTVDPAGSRIVYASGLTPDGGQVFRSDDLGHSWRQFGQVLPGKEIVAIVDPNDPDMLYTPTCGDGVFELRQETQPPPTSSSSSGCAVGPGAVSTSTSGMLLMAVWALILRRLRRSRISTPPSR